MTQYTHTRLDDDEMIRAPDGNVSASQFNHTPIETDELSFEDIHGDMPWWQKIAIGMGRGATDIGHGAQQTAAMVKDSGHNWLAELAGLTGKANTAQEITDKSNADLEIFSALQEDSPWLSGGGRLAGNAAPFLATLPVSVPAAMGLGALEGATMFTPEASFKQKGINTLIGGAAGGGGQALVNSFRAMPAPSTPEAAQAMRTAVDTGLGLRPQNVSENPAVQFVAGLSDAEMVGRNSAAVQGRKAHDIAKQAAGQFEDVDSFIASAHQRIADDKAGVDELYGVLDDIIQYAGPIDPSQVRGLASELIQKQIDTGAPNATIVNRLKKIYQAQPKEDTYEYWKQLRTQVGNNMTKWTQTGRNTSDLQAMYGSISKEMERVANDLGPAALAIHRDATAAAAEVFAKQKTRISKIISQGDEAKLNNILTGGGVTKDSAHTAAQLAQSLDAAGQEAARHRILDFAMRKATNSKGLFSPSKYAQNLQNVQKRAGVFFEGQDFGPQEIDNLANLMAHVTDPSEAKTLSQLIVTGTFAGVGGTAGQAVGSPGIGAGIGVAASQILPGAMTRPRSAKVMLEALAKHEPGSTAWNMVKEDLLRLARAKKNEELTKTLIKDAVGAPLGVAARAAGPLAASAFIQPEATGGPPNIMDLYPPIP